MRVSDVHPLTAAIFFCVISMGVLGVLVVLPIACIQWTWNSVVSGLPVLPPINVWQSALLYLAGAIVCYLLGLVRIEFHAEEMD